jgi:LPXTG-site transpeptidase (sortase) family protein
LLVVFSCSSLAFTHGRTAAVYQVTKTLDTADGACDSDCSLREAVVAANADPGSTIRVPAGPYSLTLPAGGDDTASEGDLDITADVTITGEATPAVISSAAYRVFHVHAGSVRFSLLRLTGASITNGGAVRIEPPASLVLEESTVTNSQTTLYGGGIYNNGRLTLRRSTVSGNSAGVDGGGIYNLSGTLTVENSTFSGNRANRHGGGLYAWDVQGGLNPVGLASTTLAGNTADADQNGIGAGGGLYQATANSPVGVRNSLLANNLAASAPDCLALSIQSFDYNLIETPAGCQLTGALSHTLLNVDPELGPLGDYGGPTQTSLPAGPASPVVDAGNPQGCTDPAGAPLTLDQRGQPRSQDGDGDAAAVCDIGAAELGPLAPAQILRVSKTLDSTNHAHTTGSQAAIGEIATLRISVEVSPGQLSGASIVDVLDLGLAFVGCDTWSASPGLTTNRTGGFAAACAGPSVASQPPGSTDPADRGRAVDFNLGDLANRGTSPAALTLQVRAVVLDIPENRAGVSLDSQVSLQSAETSLQAASAALEVVEPAFSLRASSDQTSLLPGTPVEIRLSIHPYGTTDAFDAVLSNRVPAGFQVDPASLQWVSGQAPDSLAYNPAARQITARWDRLDASGADPVVAFRGLLGNIDPGDEILHQAALSYSSLPGTVAAPQTPNNAFSTERDSYRSESMLTLSRVELPATGFAPGRVTLLPAQGEAAAYSSLDSLRLEIPTLQIDIPIVGVPLGPAGWDTTWLADQAGYLEGTAYPSWSGNSVLTAHNVLASGLPGPFWNLRSLKWGDPLILHAYGQRFIYEVRQVRLVSPGDLGPMQHETRPWLTLLTCRGYQEATHTYTHRLTVRAVLVKVE